MTGTVPTRIASQVPPAGAKMVSPEAFSPRATCRMGSGFQMLPYCETILQQLKIVFPR